MDWARTELARLPEPPTDGEPRTSPAPRRRGALRLPSEREQATRQAARDRRAVRYQQVQTLYQQGIPLLQIARRLRMSRATVRKFAAAAVFPERAVMRRQRSILDPYVPYLQQRWEAGCTNASQLWREIQAQGYTGVRKQVARWVQQHRSEPAPTGPKKYRHSTEIRPQTGEASASMNTVTTTSLALIAPRHLVWLLLSNVAEFDAENKATFTRIQQHPQVARAQVLAQEFQAMVRQRRPEALDSWLAACLESGIIELQNFATGLRHEYASICAALSEPWSTGQVEGQITRVKLLKRQMYGRAKFDLLKQRVLQRA